MQSLTSVVGEQSKHGPHSKIDHGLRDTDATVYAHLYNILSVQVVKAMIVYVHKILVAFAIFWK